MYCGLRCLALGSRRLHLQAAHGELPPALRTAVRHRDALCAVSRQGGLNVGTDVAHVIPHALGKYYDRADSPFYQLVELLFPAWADEVWNNSGGRHVNSPANLMVLAPTYHRIYDQGTMWLEPVYASSQYRVHFAYPQMILRHTRPFNAVACTELRHGQLIRAWTVCGSPRLHQIVSCFRRAILTYNFSPGAAGEQRDLGLHFAD